jgi:hypothetical protein
MQFFTTGVPPPLFRMPAAVSAELFAKVQFTTEGEQLKLNMAPPEVEEFPEKVQLTITAVLWALVIAPPKPSSTMLPEKVQLVICAFELPALAMAPPPRWRRESPLAVLSEKVQLMISGLQSSTLAMAPPSHSALLPVKVHPLMVGVRAS